jgi:replicative DNA helicase
MKLNDKEKQETFDQRVKDLFGETGISSDDIFTEIEAFGDKASHDEVIKSGDARDKMLAEKITFINDELSQAIPFTRENLYLMCAYSGSGKSTVAANIAYPLWKQGKKVLFLSNEESKFDVLMRIACLELGYNFNEAASGTMSDVQKNKAKALFADIMQYVKVLDVSYRSGFTTYIEDIKSALEAVKTKDYSCAIIDYYQLIQYSRKDQKKSRYDNLNDLRIWLGQYIKSSNIPVVLFAQLYSMGKRQSKEIDGRLKECSAIIEPATVILEIVPDRENQTTDFIVHKHRFNSGAFVGASVVCGFEKGRYTVLSGQRRAEVFGGRSVKKASPKMINQDEYNKLMNHIDQKVGGDAKG